MNDIAINKNFICCFLQLTNTKGQDRKPACPFAIIHLLYNIFAVSVAISIISGKS